MVDASSVRWRAYDCRPIDGGALGWWTVAWCDPGESSGWCVLHYDPGKLRLTGSVVRSIVGLTTGTLDGPFNRQVDWMMDEVASLRGVAGAHPLVVGCEDFILRRSEKSRNLLSPVHVGAKLDYALDGRVVYQPSSDMYEITKERLRLWGLWARGYGTRHGAHARDALAHSLVWCKRHGTEMQVRD